MDVLKFFNISTWTKGLPTEPGYYWFRNALYREPEQVVHVRIYVGKLAVGNSAIEGWDRMETADWAGPIPLPEERE
jgi:hypothetical protein